jgi:hypothetical protein
MAQVPQRDPIYAAARRWRDDCLVNDGSVLSDEALWTVENLAQVEQHYVQNLDASSDRFEVKLERQLGGATPEARRLTAEMLWVMMLFPDARSMGAEAKVHLVRTVWEWGGSALPHADDRLAKLLVQGIGKTGTSYNTRRWLELMLLIRFTRAVKTLAAADRRTTLDDPWATARLLATIAESGKRQLRHVLLHLLHPATFEPIASGGNRRRILAAFAAELREAGTPAEPYDSDPVVRVDQQLLQIHGVLQAHTPTQFVNYYASPLKERWKDNRPDTEDDDGDGGDDLPSVKPKHVRESVREGARAVRVWAIGAGEGAARWQSFHANGHVAIGWDDLGDLSQYADRAAVQRALKERYPSDGEPTNDALACWQFCREMAPGDEVYVKQGRARVLGYGVVRSDYIHDGARPDYQHVRAVEWRAEGDWTVPETARFPTKTLTEVTDFRALLDYLHARVRDAVPPPTPPTDAPYTLADARAEGVFLDDAALARILGSLHRRRNLILQGAPGVGKSFVARRLAYALIGARRKAAVQIVQFHQSYAYEDFVQGWRPAHGGGFELRNGVFYEFCLRAQARPDAPHVFIIDEINRGNLSKIFGELLLLIEADKRGPEFAIPLTYATSSEDTFYVPENLYLLGLMNTADRSLAMVDYALRRRFAFTTLEPAFETPGFRETLAARGVGPTVIERIITQVGAVNARIVDDTKNLGRGFEIGHSYFCPAHEVADDEAWYRAVVEDEIRPLLKEYWFDDEEQVRKCLLLLAP